MRHTVTQSIIAAIGAAFSAYIGAHVKDPTTQGAIALIVSTLLFNHNHTHVEKMKVASGAIQGAALVIRHEQAPTVEPKAIQ